MSQEQRVRMKSTIFWLWAFKSFQRCWAGRWANTNEYPHLPRLLGGIGSSSRIRQGDHHRSSYTRLGRFSLLDGSSRSSRSTSNNVASDIAWKLWGKHSSSSSQSTSSSSSQQQLNTATRFLPPIFAASLAQTSATCTQNEAQLSQHHHHGDFTHEYDEYDEYYYDEDDDNIFYLQEDVVAVRKNPTKHEQLTTTTPVESTTTTKTVIPASVKLRKRKPKTAPVTDKSSDDQQQVDIVALTQPIVPISISLEEETGEAFEDPATMDRLVESGLDMVRLETNEWIHWKIDKHSKKLLQDKTEREVLEEGDVIVYVGTAKQDGHGSHLPIIKTKSILPLSAHDMADLLMDSTRVKIYNHMSLGRTDVRTLGKDDEKDGNGKGNTKIVCNLTKPPIAKSKMVSCTLMHSRKLSGSANDGKKKKKKKHADVEAAEPRDTYLVVSRACPGMIEESMKDLPRNDILLGVNLLEDVGDNQCIMTAVTHVYSPALPTMLAKSMGVSSAIHFVKDIRKSCETTSTTETETAAKPVAVGVTATEEEIAAAAATALTGIEVK